MLSPLTASPYINIQHDYKTKEERQNYINQDIQDVYLKTLPSRIQDFNNYYTPIENKLNQLKNRIIEIQNNDTVNNRKWRKVGVVCSWIVASIGIVTVIPAMIATIIIVSNEKASTFWDFMTSGKPLEELKLRKKVSKLKSKSFDEYNEGKIIPISPSSLEISCYYHSSNDGKESKRNFSINEVQQLYLKKHPNAENIDLAKFNERLAAIHQTFKDYSAQ